MFSKLLSVYQKTLHTYPFTCQIIQAGILMGSGDLISQTFIEKRKHINWTRTARLTAVGTFYVGPILTVWYRFLYKYVGGSGTKVVLKKLAYDQFIMAPFMVGTILTILNILQGMSFDDSIAKLKQDYPAVLLHNYMLWPAAQLFNFSLMPLNYQVLVTQVVALFWNTYVSWKAHHKANLIQHDK